MISIGHDMLANAHYFEHTADEHRDEEVLSPVSPLEDWHTSITEKGLPQFGD